MPPSDKSVLKSKGNHKKTYNIELSFSEESESAEAFAKAVRFIYDMDEKRRRLSEKTSD